jgi:hypothetical protein
MPKSILVVEVPVRPKRKAQTKHPEAGPSKLPCAYVTTPLPSSQEQQEAIDGFATAILYQVALNLQADINAAVENTRHRVASTMLSGGFDFNFGEPGRPVRKGPPAKGKGKGKSRE